MPPSLHGARVTVMGLGRFGGGVGLTRWLAGRGARVLVTDLDPAERLAGSLAAIDDLVRAGTVSLRLGEHHEDDFAAADLVVANPAVPTPWANRYLLAASAAGVPITTEIRLLVERIPDRRRVVGITGSVGKSTTSAMIAHVLRESGRDVRFGGNIGGSLLPSIESPGAGDDPVAPRGGGSPWFVLELSSAMLHWLSRDAGARGAPGWSPHVAVVTNLAPNHLDWHGDLAHYAASKRQILRDQGEGGSCVVAESLRDWLPAGATHASARVIAARDAEGPPPLAIPGRHNRLNAAFALAAASLVGVEPDAARRAIATFRGLPDRLQSLGGFVVRAGVRVRAFNDSKSTTPQSATLAVDAMDDDPTLGARRVRLICGGYDKKIDLAPLAQAAARCAASYTIGATGPWLAGAAARLGGVARSCGDLASAVRAAIEDARDGDVILLSPGCASWDQFVNYEARGAAFARLLREASPEPVA